MQVKITLPEPHDKQQDFLRSPAKRKVIVAGRRGGKTTGVSILAAEGILAGRRILEAAPTREQTDVFWESVKKFLQPLIDTGHIYKNESRRIMEMPATEGRIKTKTAWDADSMRGDYADLLIMDEYAEMDPSAWNEVAAPMLLDNDGDAVFIFTPKRRNHAWHAYQRAKQDESGRWAAWHFTSHDNPFLSKPALAEITEDMTEDAYQQEIMAQFLENEGVVFRNIDANMTPAEWHEAGYWWDGGEHGQHHHCIAGLDWGKHNDYTVLSVGCVRCRKEVALMRFNKIDYTYQRQRVGTLAEIYGFVLLPERNSMGEPNIESMLRDNFRIANGPDSRPGFNTSATTKPPLIENLALSLEREQWQFLDIPLATAELEAYERKIMANNRSQYSAPEGLHDDTVIARALMRWLSRSVVSLPKEQPAQQSRWKQEGLPEGKVNAGQSRWKRY